MNTERIREISERADLQTIGPDEALVLAGAEEGEEFEALLAGADRLRRKHRGNAVSTCAIVNAKSGRCGEDCKFCAQSVHYETNISTFEFIGKERVLDAARKAKAAGAREFSVVVAGRKMRKTEMKEAFEIFPEILREGLSTCGSLGALAEDELGELKRNGLRMFHHNLETSRSNYRNVASTRDYETNRESVRAAKRQGLFVCSGGIFGMGETWAQRVELFMDLRELNVDSVPINFLNPIPGTPFGDLPPLAPAECLKIIAVARHIMPAKQILVAGGRERNLGDRQADIFRAGASGILIGDYLTTKGQAPERDHEMIRELGLEFVPCAGHAHETTDAAAG